MSEWPILSLYFLVADKKIKSEEIKICDTQSKLFINEKNPTEKIYKNEI